YGSCRAPSKVREQQKNSPKRLSLAESGARMETVVDGAQARLDHMRVDLRRRQIAMAEHHLNRPEVGAPLEQVRRERMPHDVRAERRRQVGAAAVLFQDFPEADPAERPAARVEEQAR